MGLGRRVRQAASCVCWEIIAGVACLLASRVVSRGPAWPEAGLQAGAGRALFWLGIACLCYGLIVDSYLFIHAVRHWNDPSAHAPEGLFCPRRPAPPGILAWDIRDIARRLRQNGAKRG